MLACGGAPVAPDNPKSSAKQAAPLTRVTYSTRRRHSVQAGERLMLFDHVGFSFPSAVIFDPRRDVYWVSNANVDGPGHGGFISRLDPEAIQTTLNFIDGQSPGVKLDTPHGLAVNGDVLFVADVTAIRKFKADSGEPLGSIEIPGSRYLSDVAFAADGTLYVSDVGSDPNVAALPESAADAVYQVSPTGEVSVVARRPDLGGPYALVADEKGLWVTCAGTSELLLLVPDAKGAPARDAGRLPLPGAAPRGIARMPDGTLLISSWTGGVVYRGFHDGPFAPVVTGLESPADLGYDTKRERLLIPLFNGHALAVFELSPMESSSGPAH